MAARNRQCPAAPRSDGVIREVTNDDRESVNALLRRHDMAGGALAADAWSSMWDGNPFDQGGTRPKGWVLDGPEGVCGYLGSIPFRYHFGGRQLVGAAAHAFAVDAQHRSHSLRLAAAFFLQPGVDLIINTTANAATMAIFQLCKAQRIPQPGYATALFWVADESGFSEALLRRWGTPASAAVAARALGPALKIESRLRSRGPVPAAARWQFETMTAGEIGDEFDGLWRRWVAGHLTSLVADRSAAALRWHYKDRGTQRRAVIVCARDENGLQGFAALVRDDNPEIGLRRWRIADMMVLGDEPVLVDALVERSFRHAQLTACHVLEAVGFPAHIRARLVAGAPHERELPSWPFWYKASPAWSEALSDARVWYATSYDGDATF